MGGVVALGIEQDLSEKLRTKQDPGDSIFAFDASFNRYEIVREIKSRGDSLDLILLGPEVDDPVQMAQRIHAIDRTVSIVALVPEWSLVQSKRAFQFAPFIGDQVQCVFAGDIDSVLGAIDKAIQKTQSRRRHASVVSKINQSAASSKSPVHAATRTTVGLDKLLDSAPIGIALIDEQGHVLSWNKNAQLISGISERGSLNLRCQDLFAPVDGGELGPVISEASGKEWPTALNAVFLQGPVKRYFEVTIANLGSDFPGNLMVVFHDISGRFEAERTLLQAKQAAEAASEAKTQFLANMSHEIRTPIGVILGFLELLKQPGNTPSDFRDYVTTMDRNGKQLLRLIDDILDLSRMEAGKFVTESSRFSLRQHLVEIQSMLHFKASEKGLGLRVVLDSSVPDMISADPLRLRQILFNLIGNSIKFSETGTIEIEVSFQAGTLRFRITDTGIGLTPEQAGSLFQPFSQADASVTRKFGGTGLGLALSKRLAEAMGGELHLEESTLNKGATFAFSLPVMVCDAGTPPEPAEKKPDRSLPLESMRILFVEDSRDNQILVSRILRHLGAQVDLASDGEAGIRLALEKTYDVVLMDMQMPICGGIEATRRLRAQGYDRPIVALTAHAMEEDRRKSLGAGCTDHLSKPVSRKDLAMALTRYQQPGDSKPAPNSSSHPTGGAVPHHRKSSDEQLP